MNQKYLLSLLVALMFVLGNCTGASLIVIYSPGANSNPAKEYTTTGYYKGGGIFHLTSTPGPLGLGAEIKSEAKGCNHAVLGLFSYGDSSVETAKKAGNISKVAFIEYETLGIIGGWVYHRFCTVVKGS